MDPHSTFDLVKQHQQGLRMEASAAAIASGPGMRRGLAGRLRRAQPVQPRGRPAR